MKSTAQPHAVPTERMVDRDRNSVVQDQLILSKEQQVAALVKQVGPVDPEFVLLDLGCGPGHGSVFSSNVRSRPVAVMGVGRDERRD